MNVMYLTKLGRDKSVIFFKVVLDARLKITPVSYNLKKPNILLAFYLETIRYWFLNNHLLGFQKAWLLSPVVYTYLRRC